VRPPRAINVLGRPRRPAVIPAGLSPALGIDMRVDRCSGRLVGAYEEAGEVLDTTILVVESKRSVTRGVGSPAGWFWCGLPVLGCMVRATVIFGQFPSDSPA